MLKFLRSFALMAAMLLPFAAQAQETLTVADGTTTSVYLPLWGNWADAAQREQSIYPADMLTDMTGNAITQLTYYVNNATSPSWLAGDWQVSLGISDAASFSSASYDVTTSLTLVHSGALAFDADTRTLIVEFDAPFVYTGGNLLVEFNLPTATSFNDRSFYGVNVTSVYGSVYGHGSVSRTTFLPKVTFTHEALGNCKMVQNLAASNITHNSLTLTWADTINTGATYTVLNGEDVVAANVTGTTYAISNLAPYTNYTFSVITNCTDGEMSPRRNLNVRTLCGPVQLPYSTSFENNELGDAYSSSYNLPACWSRYNDGTNNSYNNYPYSYGSYGYTGSRCLYLSLNFTAGYGDTILAIMPQVDVTSFPMNNNQVRFMGRTYNPNMMLYVQVGTMTDPSDHSTFVADDTVLVSTNNVYAEYEAKLGVHSNGAWPAFRFIKNPSTTITAYIDDVNIEVQPTCFVPRNITVSDVTSNSAKLNWQNSENEGATVSIMRTTDTDTAWFHAAAGDTAYTFANLDPNTNYSFTLRTVCSATDSSRAVMVSTRTLRNEHDVVSFNASGTMKRADVVIDSATFSVTVPVWYNTSLSNLSFSWTLSSGAYAFIDTAADGSYTCQLNTTSIKNYLHVNVPMTIRVKAEDNAFYTDFTLLLQGETCVADRNLQIAPERIRYTATWDNPDTLVTEHWFINSVERLDATALASAQHITVSNAHQYTVEGLSRGTKYYMYLKTPCDSVWIEDSVTTKILQICDVYDGSTGTSTARYFFPGYYGWQYSGNLYSVTENMAANGFSAYLATGNASTGAHLQVWVKEVGPDFAFDNTTTFETMAQDAMLVYDGDANYTSAMVGWIDFTFPQSLNLTAGNQLLILSRGVGCSTSGGCTRYERTTSKTSKQWYKQADSSDPGMSTTGSVGSSRLNIKLCYEDLACPDVSDIHIDSLSNTIANLSWTASSADYCVGNQIIVSPTMLDADGLEGATPALLAANATSYNATGLTPDHDYFVYVRALCNGTEHPEGMSGWASFEFHTFPTVRTPEIVSTQFVGKHEARLEVANTGAAIGQPTNFSYIVSTTLLDETALANATPSANGIDTTIVDVNGLNSATTYYFYFRNAMDNEVSPWSAPDSVTMPSATPAVFGLNVTNVAHNAMTAYWMRNVENYADETAWKAAIVLHGQEPAANDWVIVTDTLAEAIAFHPFLGLLTDTAYDIYVMPYFAATQTTGDTALLDSVRTATFPTSCETVGTGTTTTSYFLPGYYGWQYYAGLYEAPRTGVISALSFNVSTGNTGNGATMTVWAKVVDASFELTNESVFSDLIADADTIYNGAVAYTPSDLGWNQLTVANPITISEGQQLLVLTRGVGCTASGGCSRSVYGTTVSGKSYYKAQDSSDPGISSVLASTTARANLQLCYVPTSCLDVSTVMNNHLSDTSVDLMWYPGDQETTWKFAYSTSDSLSATELETLAQTLTTPNIHLSGLVHDTSYTIYIRSICSDSETGNWIKRRFTTPHVNFYDATVVVNDSTMGTANGVTEVREGSEATLTATANEGFELYKWTFGDSTVYGTTTLTLTMDSNISVNAYFRYASSTIAASEVTFWSGTGANQAVLAVNWADTSLAWGVNFSTENITVQNAMDTIVANDPRFSFVMDGGYLTDILFVENGDTLRGTSYWESTLNGVMDGGMSQQLANGDFEKWGDPAAGQVYDSAYYEGWGWSFFYTYPMAVNAVTAPVFYTVTVNFDETMGTVTGAPTAPVFVGTEVTLTATPNDGYHFIGWSNGIADSIITFTVTEDTTLTANFEANTQYFTVAVNFDETMGTVTGIPTEAVEEGTVVTLTATAGSGFVFTGWSNGLTDATISITVNSDTTLTANFDTRYYTINVTVNDNTMGYVTGSGRYAAGSIVVLEAHAEEGYHFVRWSNGQTDAHIEIEATEDLDLEAFFEADGTTGISDIEGANATVFAADGKIFVKGAENMNVYVYDVNGRCVMSLANATETEEISVNGTGVYLVKVANAPAKRVVVLR
ncbi:MAG: fibronectin type III domain-containing protein [Bacteroidales bacterium]|nr:fibronectin type III domain-containing protein [Bacteroidales bacterium]